MQLALVFCVFVCWFSKAFGWIPSNSYAPAKIDCPKDVDSFVRRADDLNKDEKDWVSERQKTAKPALIDFLDRGNLSDFKASDFLSNTSLNVALAFSGGGYRAMLAGAGQFSALDNRTVNATDKGHLGGLVQASTYLAGLSGGNWLVGSITLNNFSSIQDLQGDEDVWDLEHSLISPGGINIFSTAKYWDKIDDAVDAKEDAGFNTSLTDIWGRGLSQQFIGLKEGGPAMTWNDIQEYSPFKNHEMPFPIVVADGREPGTKIIAANSTVFEFTPYELGSWDPALYAFTDVKYLGSEFDKGKTNGTCVTGLAQSGFVMGTSSSLFNQFILQLNSTGVSGVIYKLADKILTKLGKENDDIAIYSPNPFKGIDYGNSTIKDAKWLTLVDGGEDGQNIPLHPLIQPEREVDVIFAFDNSADTDYSWPNGTSMVTTYERQFNYQSNSTAFPYVPDQDTFINDGLVERPTFFGCYAENMTDLIEAHPGRQEGHVPPLLVYIGNFAHSYFSNTSTFKLSYDTEEVAGMIQNGYNTATRQNSTLDSDWHTCLSCAIIQRELERRGQSQSDQCKKCFDKYCWNGKTNNTKVDKQGDNYAPTLSVKGSGAAQLSANAALGLCVALMAVAFSVIS